MTRLGEVLGISKDYSGKTSIPLGKLLTTDTKRLLNCRANENKLTQRSGETKLSAKTFHCKTRS